VSYCFCRSVRVGSPRFIGGEGCTGGAANALAGEGYPVDTDELATICPYITRTIRRFGSWVVDLSPPAIATATRLDLES
jgi:hypothetical protein